MTRQRGIPAPSPFVPDVRPTKPSDLAPATEEAAALDAAGGFAEGDLTGLWVQRAHASPINVAHRRAVLRMFGKQADGEGVTTTDSLAMSKDWSRGCSTCKTRGVLLVSYGANGDMRCEACLPGTAPNRARPAVEEASDER